MLGYCKERLDMRIFPFVLFVVLFVTSSSYTQVSMVEEAADRPVILRVVVDKEIISCSEADGIQSFLTEALSDPPEEPDDEDYWLLLQRTHECFLLNRGDEISLLGKTQEEMETQTIEISDRSFIAVKVSIEPNSMVAVDMYIDEDYNGYTISQYGEGECWVLATFLEDKTIQIQG